VPLFSSTVARRFDPIVSKRRKSKISVWTSLSRNIALRFVDSETEPIFAPTGQKDAKEDKKKVHEQKKINEPGQQTEKNMK
jgi:hypothetical protein